MTMTAGPVDDLTHTATSVITKLAELLPSAAYFNVQETIAVIAEREQRLKTCMIHIYIPVGQNKSDELLEIKGIGRSAGTS